MGQGPITQANMMQIAETREENRPRLILFAKATFRFVISTGLFNFFQSFLISYGQNILILNHDGSITE